MMTDTEKALIETSNKLCADLEAKLNTAISALEELKELNCACGNHYIGGNLESYLCIQCKALEQIKKESQNVQD